jgi:hypothetical protein
MDGLVEGAGAWAAQEIDIGAFRDKRLGSRLATLLRQMGSAIGGSLPMACQDWANTKAAYRFLSNSAVGESAILAGHFEATRLRSAATEGQILVLQDTTEFSYQRANPERIGFRGLSPSRRDATGKLRLHLVCGVLMHGSLAVTPEGLPLGLTAVKFWMRAEFKGTNALKRHINPTRVPIEQKESYRWLENMRQSTALLGDPDRLIHIGDRENDIYEFFCETQKLGAHFLVRACVDRLAGDGSHTVATEMADAAVQGVHRIEIGGDGDYADLELRYKRVRVLPPIGKQKRYPALDLMVLHACERDEPKDRARIDWKLITDLTVDTPEAAIEKLNWYATRWKIETFHKILKSGCRAEDARLRTAERLVNLIAIFCILAWRIFWLTMMNRAAPEALPGLALTVTEISILDRIRPDKRASPKPSLAHYLNKIASLGGYLARAHDPPPGNIVMWRGWQKLSDIAIGVALERELVGN